MNTTKLAWNLLREKVEKNPEGILGLTLGIAKEIYWKEVFRAAYKQVRKALEELPVAQKVLFPRPAAMIAKQKTNLDLLREGKEVSIETTTKNGNKITLTPCHMGDRENRKFWAKFFHPKLKKNIEIAINNWTDSYGKTGKAGAWGNSVIGGICLEIPKKDYQECLELSKIITENRKVSEKEEEKKQWDWANENCLSGCSPVIIKPGITGYLDKWETENGEVLEPDYRRHIGTQKNENWQDFLYVETSYVLEQKEKKAKEQEKEKAKKEAEEKRENEKREKFEEAKRTGKRVLLTSYNVDCNDYKEECDMDIVSVYAMPDGTTIEKRFHAH